MLATTWWEAAVMTTSDGQAAVTTRQDIAQIGLEAVSLFQVMTFREFYES